MREYAKKPENQSRTLDSNPRASKQAPISEILQVYRNKTLGKLVQRQGIDDDKLLQPKFEPAPAAEQAHIQCEEKPNNTGLPDNLKSGIENLSGYSMDDVKVHYNSGKPVQLNALAYAQGTDIHVAPGQEQHLPHEAWHVVQQKQGRVQPTIQKQGVQINDNKGLESDADAMGKEALNNVNQDSSIRIISNIGDRIVQKKVTINGENYEKIPEGWSKMKQGIKIFFQQWIDEQGKNYIFRDEAQAILMAQILNETMKNLAPDLMLEIYKHTDYNGLKRLFQDLEIAEITELTVLEKIHDSTEFKNFITLPSDDIKRLLPFVKLNAKIEHKTVFAAPDSSANDRKTVGVGEEINFEGNAPGKWTTSDGKNMVDNKNTFKWTAPDRASNTTIKFEFQALNKKEATTVMNVIEPDTISATKIKEKTYNPGTAGAGMKLRFTYYPLNVSFGNIEVKEVSGPATNISGYFAKRYSPNNLNHDSGDLFTAINNNNTDSAVDTAAGSGFSPPYEEGHFDWLIPNNFKVKTESGDGKTFHNVIQAFHIWASGKVKITKAGAEVERTP